MNFVCNIIGKEDSHIRVLNSISSKVRWNPFPISSNTAFNPTLLASVYF